MAATYNFGKNRNANTEAVYHDISQFFCHLVPAGIELQGFELKPDGTITVRTRDPIPPEFLAEFDLKP